VSSNVMIVGAVSVGEGALPYLFRLRILTGHAKCTLGLALIATLAIVVRDHE
jgi:hypothetical protein